jgi:hypothetical protein
MPIISDSAIHTNLPHPWQTPGESNNRSRGNPLLIGFALDSFFSDDIRKNKSIQAMLKKLELKAGTILSTLKDPSDVQEFCFRLLDITQESQNAAG